MYDYECRRLKLLANNRPINRNDIPGIQISSLCSIFPPTGPFVHTQRLAKMHTTSLLQPQFGDKLKVHDINVIGSHNSIPQTGLFQNVNSSHTWLRRLIVMRHLQPSPLETALDVESLIRLGTVEDGLYTINIGRGKREISGWNAPYNTQPSPQHNPAPE